MATAGRGVALVRYGRHVASNLACIGLDVDSRDEFDELVAALLPDAVSLGRSGRTEVLRWQDPSGARLVFEVHAGTVEGILPSYDALTGASVAELALVDDDVAIGWLTDGDEQVGQIALEVEERRLVLGKRAGFSGPVSIVGLGVGAEIFDDADAFAAAPASLLHADPDHVPEPSPHVVEFKLPWPPRMATESILPFGVFAEPHDIDAYARVNGTVLGASTRTVERTGQSFHAVRVRTAGFDMEMCIPTAVHPELPRTGQVIAAMAFMVGSLGASTPRPKRLHMPRRA